MDNKVRAKELIEGSIDFHIHTGPDVFPRLVNDIEAAKQAKEAKMKAILLKNHVTGTGDRAQIASQVVGFPVFGGIALNLPVGGVNPQAVEMALRMGAKEVWMPTIHAAHYLKEVDNVPMFAKLLKSGIKGINLLNQDGSLTNGVREVLALIAQYDGIMATGHISIQEAMALVPEAKKIGVKKIVVTHPLSPMENYSINDMKEILARGATMLEHVVNDITHQMKNPIPASKIAEAIKALGAETAIMSTDSGQVINPAPVCSMENFIREMLDHGIPEKDIMLMTRDNPAGMLGIQA
ncbi:MAG: DUF6282 family protein [Candidatus Korobacteraceae bacterium]|jgi:hypothetical protein